MIWLVASKALITQRPHASDDVTNIKFKRIQQTPHIFGFVKLKKLLKSSYDYDLIVGYFVSIELHRFLAFLLILVETIIEVCNVVISKYFRVFATLFSFFKRFGI